MLLVGIGLVMQMPVLFIPPIIACIYVWCNLYKGKLTVTLGTPLIDAFRCDCIIFLWPQIQSHLFALDFDGFWIDCCQ